MLKQKCNGSQQQESQEHSEQLFPNSDRSYMEEEEEILNNKVRQNYKELMAVIKKIDRLSEIMGKIQFMMERTRPTYSPPDPPNVKEEKSLE